MAHLEIEGRGESRRVEITDRGLTIGRIPGCDLVVEAETVSRSHARIVRRGDEYVLEDLRSHNGTFLNGRQILTPTPLRDGDRIGISGEVVATFHSGVKLLHAVIENEGLSSTIVASTDASPEAVSTGAARSEEKLRAILEISRSLGGSLEVDELLPRILDSLFRIFPNADRGFVLLKDQAGVLVPKAIHSRRQQEEARVAISRTIVESALQGGQAILSTDALTDSQFDDSRSIVDLRIRSVMCAPLRVQAGESLGVIQLHTETARNAFTREDLEVLASTANAAALALENARMHERLLARDRLERELELAREVQRGFLPSRLPEASGYDFYAFYEPALRVGGDYYGFVELPGERILVAVGDVSGKGLSAALLMARLSSDIRSAAVAETDPAAALAAVNRSLGEVAADDRFVTLLCMVLDRRTHELSVVNAGHLPPVVRWRDGKVEELFPDRAGVPLNVDPSSRFEVAVTKLEPGTLLLAYTDGLSEAASPSGELFGSGRIQTVMADEHAGAADTGAAVIAAVRAFTGTGPASDDMTLVCFGRT